MSRSIKTLIKRSLCAALYYSGIAWLYYAWAVRDQALVLMYHRVLPAQPPADSYSTDAIVVTPETFERQMRFLRRHFKPVSVEHFDAMLRGEAPWQSRTCVVTFDDGWFDNLEHALPILERTQVPAMVFVATGYLGTSSTFWQERLTRMLFSAWQLGTPARALFEQLGASQIPSLDGDSARTQIRDLITTLKERGRAEIDKVTEQTARLLTQYGITPAGNGDDRFMSWADAQTLTRSGVVTLGSHAHSHAPLTSVGSEDVRGELGRSATELQNRISARPRFFAYPNGDHNDAVVALVDAAQYRLAFTTIPGWVGRGDHPLRLKRINIAEQGTESHASFMCRLLCWW